MVLHPHSIKPIPPLTKEIAHKAFPKGSISFGNLILMLVYFRFFP